MTPDGRDSWSSAGASQRTGRPGGPEGQRLFCRAGRTLWLLLVCLLAGCVPPDEDGDGFVDAEDCGPTDPAVHPGAVEICDGLDSDCDGGLPNSEQDADGDLVAPCAGDCNDADSTVAPGELEACDGVDSDCDGVLPNDEADSDLDGVPICAGDCDDSCSSCFPGAPETDICDGLDEDCIFDPLELDSDGDGYRACSGLECDDSDAGRHVGAEERCNRLDDDCDGVVDNGLLDAVPFGGSLPDTSAVFTIRGTELEGYDNVFGQELGWPGDVNADGYEDLLVSSSGGPGWLFLGPFAPCEYVLGQADAVLATTDNFGFGDWKVRRVGDLNLDGVSDILIGNTIYFGPVESDRNVEEADVIVHGTGPTTSPGDVNCDGWPDLVAGFQSADHPSISTPPWENPPGVVSVWYGPLDADLYYDTADALLIGERVDSALGRAVAAAGDTNGDGCDDLLVSAHWDDTSSEDAGAVYLLRGPIMGEQPVDLAAFSKWAGAPGEFSFGYSVAMAEDLAGGASSWVAVAQGGSSPSKIYLAEVPESPSETTIDPAAAWSLSGPSLGSRLRRVTGPLQGLLASEPGAGFPPGTPPWNAGSVRWLSSTAGFPDDPPAFYGTSTGHFGTALDWFLRSDGRYDIAIGAPYDQRGGALGRVYVWRVEGAGR